MYVMANNVHPMYSTSLTHTHLTFLRNNIWTWDCYFKFVSVKVAEIS